MKIEISNNTLEYMLSSGMIMDFTDDGFVYREDSGWVRAGDVIEFYLGMEAFELDKAKERLEEVRGSRPAKEKKEQKT